MVKQAILSLAFVTLLQVGTPAQQESPTYIVSEGDSLFAIAQIFGKSVEELAAANGIEDPATIFPGQQLVIPGLEGLAGVLKFADIQYGENLHSVALRYGPNRDLLGRLNRVLNPQRLYVGQSIIVPAGEDTASAWATSLKGSTDLGRSVLEAAAGMGLDPWTLTRGNHLQARRWSVPGELLFAAGDGMLTTALPPEIGEVMILPDRISQGTTVIVEFRSPTATEIEARLGPWRLNMVESATDSQIALQGVHALADTGLNDLQVTSGGTAGYSQPVFVSPGEYGRETLQVPPETLDPANTRPENELIAGIVGQVTPEKLWDGPFSYPTTFFDAFPSVFGTRRSYNGSEFIYYHAGLDLFGGTTTPVLAPARGRVVFSDFLTVRGNVTYIDHGWGVFTGYLHQSESLVEAAQMVEIGETIGFVGGSGRVTGAHLHWEVWVGGVPVDPIEWTESDFP